MCFSINYRTVLGLRFKVYEDTFFANFAEFYAFLLSLVVFLVCKMKAKLQGVPFLLDSEVRKYIYEIVDLHSYTRMT